MMRCTASRLAQMESRDGESARGTPNHSWWLHSW